jgi:hypothetical protein
VTRSSRGEGGVGEGGNSSAIASLASIPTRKWDKRMVQVGSMWIAQYIPDKPERTLELSNVAKISLKRTSQKRSRKHLKSLVAGQASVGGQGIESQDMLENADDNMDMIMDDDDN